MNGGVAAFARSGAMLNLDGKEITVHPQGGLTKREWFAGMAHEFEINLTIQKVFDAERKWISPVQARYRFADEMLAEGEK